MTKEYLKALETYGKLSLAYQKKNDNLEDWNKLDISYKVIKQALQRLEAIDNANPSEALKDLEIIRESMLKYRNKIEEVKVKCIISPQFASIRQALLKAQEQEKKLDRVEKYTKSLFKERKKIGQDFIVWCRENNVEINNVANMLTWVLCVLLREVLCNDTEII